MRNSGAALVLGGLLAACLATAGRAGAAEGSLKKAQEAGYDPVPLKELQANPKAYLDRAVCFKVIYSNIGRIFEPLHTPFTSDAYLNVHVWDIDARLWLQTERQNAFAFLYAPRKDGRLLSRLNTLKVYQPLLLCGRVASGTQDQPWIEIERLERLPGEVPYSNAALGNVEQAYQRLAAGDRVFAAQFFETALGKGLPVKAQAEIREELGQVYLDLGRPVEAERSLRQAVLQGGESAARSFLLGEVLSSPERLREAAAEYQRATELSPGMIKAYNRLALVSAKLGETTGDATLFEAGLEATRRAAALARPKSPEMGAARRAAGVIQAAAGRLELADKAYDDATQADSHALYYRERAALRVRMADRDESRAHDAAREAQALQLAVAQAEAAGDGALVAEKRAEAQVTLQRADQLEQSARQHLEAAARFLYDEIQVHASQLALAPQAEPYFERARLRHRLGLTAGEESDRADLQAAIRADANFLEPYYFLARILFENNEVSAADAVLRQLLGQRPGEPALALRAAELYADAASGLPETRQNQRTLLYAQAADLSREVVRREPKNAAAWLALGLVETERRNPAAAIEALTRAVALERNHPRAHWLLGLNYSALGEYAKSLEHHAYHKSLQPDDWENRKELAWVAALLGDVKRTIAELEELHRARPRELELTNALAFYLVEFQGDARRGAALAREAFDGLALEEPEAGAAPEALEAYYTRRADFADVLGWAGCRQGRFGPAREFLALAVADGRGTCVSWYHLAVASLEAGGSIDQAQEALLRAEQLLPAVQAQGPEAINYPVERLTRAIAATRVKLNRELHRLRRKPERALPPEGVPARPVRGGKRILEAPEIPAESASGAAAPAFDFAAEVDREADAGDAALQRALESGDQADYREATQHFANALEALKELPETPELRQRRAQLEFRLHEAAGLGED